jgi:sugar O-acyltransferase (sialic acid O-acetyltransferase NeuD family)
MSKGKLAIIGAGGNARELAEICRGLDYEVAGFLIDGTPGPCDSPNLGDFTWLEKNKVDGLVMGVGLPTSKLRLSQDLKSRFPSIEWPVIVDPSAYVGKNVDLDEGAVIGIRAVLTINISIGKFTQVNFAASIGHETTIGRACVINPGANISGGVVVHDGVMIGSNATILQYISIGAGATVGAGAVVTKDVASQLQVVGVPAKPMSRSCSPKFIDSKSSKTLWMSCIEERRLWDELVSSSPTPDTYFRPGYALAYTDENTTAAAVVLCTSKRRFLVPLLLRKLSMLSFVAGAQDCDALTPYGYGGVLPLNAGDVSADDAAEVIEGLKQWCLKNNVVSCLLRLHPLMDQETGFGSANIQAAGGVLRPYGPTKAIDLMAWDENLSAPAGMNSNRRRNLNFARRNLSIVVAPCDTPEGLELMEPFREIYEETMRRVSASSYYFFSDKYYSALARGLGSKLAVAIASRGTDAVGGALLFADARFGHYHLGGTTADGLNLKAHTLVLVAAAEWARRQGCRWFHLGGGRTSDDSLYQFKNSFGASTFFYSFLTIIASRDRYDELVRLRNGSHEIAPPQEDYFPEYRA